MSLFAKSPAELEEDMARQRGRAEGIDEFYWAVEKTFRGDTEETDSVIGIGKVMRKLARILGRVCVACGKVASGGPATFFLCGNCDSAETDMKGECQ